MPAKLFLVGGRFAVRADGGRIQTDYVDSTGTSRTGWCDLGSLRIFAEDLLHMCAKADRVDL